MSDSRTPEERLLDAIFSTPQSIIDARNLGRDYAMNPEDHDPAFAHEDMSDEATAFWEACHQQTRAVQRLVAAISPNHEFLPVAGHPDDDECTFREDGTDATYCGEPESEHNLPASTTGSETDRG